MMLDDTPSPTQQLPLPLYQKQLVSYNVDSTTTVTLPKRYEPVRDEQTGQICILGQGGYGIVIAARDRQHGNRLVAIKKIGDVFNVAPYRMLREVLIMKHLRGHPFIVELIDIFVPGQTLSEMNDLYIVLGMMNGGDLKQLMSQKVQEGGISMEGIKDIMCQLLSALHYMHSAGILHRDLKPSNILVGNNGDELQFRLCDFGLSTKEESDSVTNPESMYVVTRYYRPPEVILQYEIQSSAIDAWSAGCIFAELLYLLPPKPQRRPLFVARKSGANIQGIEEHLNLIVSLLGKPEMSDVKGTANGVKYFERLFGLYPSDGLDLKQIFTSSPPEALDLLRKFLIWNPEKRISFDEAVNHPFLKGNKYINLTPHPEKIEIDIEKKADSNTFKYMFYQEVIEWANRNGEQF
ncbi:protein kinase [Naegleria gruberi]|uniref:Protein kinase n=1 Tax=Naegleria gruberi TaxID=5762 RepID=D2VKQ2_NAEGR|nr:protein kinase [Naegleria gruberi]EFC42730.1 protein kinase [Naegleria gruberi]|eukprot:XP_002675474.1 protein kinase [Naegleria gruberi]